MALYMYFNSLDILTIWLRDTVLAQNSQPYFSFLILANLAMLIQFPLYQILIAKGVPKYNLYFGLACRYNFTNIFLLIFKRLIH